MLISVNDKINFNDFNDEELISVYAEWIKELKIRNIIRTSNIVGEIGEYLAINYYNKTAGLPKLVPAAISTKSVDAISSNGERYTIKTVTTNTTGVFYGVDSFENKLFEKAIIIQLDKKFELKRIIEIDWKIFYQFKHWHSRMQAYNINITKDLINNSKIIFSKEVVRD